MNLQEIESSSYLADLLVAMQENNMDKTITCVDKLNELKAFEGRGDYPGLFRADILTNDCTIYAIEHLDNLNNSKELLWEHKLHQVEATGDRNKIKDYINQYNTVDAMSELEFYQIQSLFTICLNFSLYDVLSNLRKVFFDAKNQLAESTNSES